MIKAYFTQGSRSELICIAAARLEISFLGAFESKWERPDYAAEDSRFSRVAFLGI
jgi:hypothetical protein